MPTLPASPIEENVALRSQGLGAYPSSSSEVLGATAEEAWVTNPIPSLWQTMKANPIHRERVLAPFLPEPKTITPEEANQKYGIEGELKFYEPIFDDVAQDYHKMKRDELARRDIYQRSKGGALLSTAQFGVGLGVSIVDPLNIASAFIPVVGSTRYALMLERAGTAAGRAGVRTAVGAAEGLVGAAVVEPLIYTAATQRQADYDATDSLLNLAFGTVLGGGLHAGLGALGDAIRAKKLEEPLLREGVASVIEDRPVTVDANLRAAMADRPAPIGEAIPGVPTATNVGIDIPVTERAANIEITRLPPLEGNFLPPIPNADDFIRLARIEQVPLDRVHQGQKEMDFGAFAEGVSPGPLYEGFSDKPVAARMNNGDLVMLDGHHRTVTAINAGKKELDMYVINVSDYAPADAGKISARIQPEFMPEDDELLRALGLEDRTAPIGEANLRARVAESTGVAQETAGVSARQAEAMDIAQKQISEAYAPGVKPWDAPSVKAVDEIVERAPRDNISDETRAIQEEIALYETLAGTLDDAEAAFIKEADDMNTFADQFAAATEAVARCRIGRS